MVCLEEVTKLTKSQISQAVSEINKKLESNLGIKGAIRCVTKTKNPKSVTRYELAKVVNVSFNFSLFNTTKRFIH